eukprot:CAMPEP_0171105922 /NCGR_PEP_ID=MMETSP0766_2-20121228/63729_1 /TAXON_ID=439317 /ORGANISM="Gambierdiscus australes, Strain CAWD 149" /LENGTH=102 /DNA_ID=CAMNT_0011566897 /DNA_START=310 /DNA_END=614 /DNA_ORIENTATION=-
MAAEVVIDPGWRVDGPAKRIGDVLASVRAFPCGTTSSRGRSISLFILIRPAEEWHAARGHGGFPQRLSAGHRERTDKVAQVGLPFPGTPRLGALHPHTEPWP